MRKADKPVVKPGMKLNSCISVIDVVDDGGKDPVCIVWHHGAWCPMACKVFASHDRAQQEAELLKQVNHPNIVRMLGLELPGCLLMEFVEGPTLSNLIDMNPHHRLGVSDTLRLAIHTGCALQHVHRAGYAHLDVKPDNVIVDKNGRPVLFDFGSARKLAGTRPDRVIGTDPYISPEECELGEVTSASDVFSLGVTIYECLTGELPFPGSCKTAKRHFPQVSVPAVAISQHRRRLPAGLGRLVMSMLAVNPCDRPGLDTLLPQLHKCIVSGPRMWPESFDPGVRAGPVARPGMRATT